MKVLLPLLTAALLALASPVFAEDSSSAADESSSSAEPAPPAPLGPGVVAASDPQSVLDALTALGYLGKLEKLDDGRPTINVQISGLRTYIDFYDCADDMTDCYTLLFGVALDLKDGTTADEANKWNSTQISGRVWLDENKDPTLDFSLSTFDGIPEAVFDQNVKLWDKKINDFKDAFHF